MNESRRHTSLRLWTRQALQQVNYHCKTLWLFTFSDLKTTVIPSTAFALLNALVPTVYGLQPVQTWQVAAQIPSILIWIWINLLAFDVDNQRHAASVLEDKTNKPWRPLPSGRIKCEQANALVFILYPTAFIISYFSGGLQQSLCLAVLGAMYNRLGGASHGVITRNLLNAGGFVCFISGAFDVALQFNASTSASGARVRSGLAIIGLIVFSTIHVQDMEDQAGDRLRNRQTLPLVLGDGVARLLIAGPVVMWTWLCSAYWGLGWMTATPGGILGAFIALRTCSKRSVTHDRLTFRLWNLWMVWLYMMPLILQLAS